MTGLPDFVVVSADGSCVSLADLRGQLAVLAFHRAQWDPVRPHHLAHLGAIVAQVPDGDARIPFLAGLPTSGQVANHFGVRDEETVIVLGADGIVRWRHAGPITASDGDSLATALLVMETGASTEKIELVHATRRQFVASALAAAIVIAVSPALARAESVATRIADVAKDSATLHVTLNVNGREVALDIEPRVTLLDALREYAGLTGTKKGCDHGQCGACTVHVDGRRQLSCLSFAAMHQGAKVTTVEGLAVGDTLHPMQAAFIKHDGFQCGYCTPGQLMSATALLTEPCGKSDADVKECMSGNLCRCGAYPGIVAAIQEVRG
ncbi:hypothetical protein BH11GEM1_BH11GEM1_05180 [soil metagenome]